MRRDTPDAPSGLSLLSVIGWIFADMLLVLVVIFLATQTGGAVAPNPVSSSRTTPPPTTTTTTATTTTPALPPGVDSNYVCFRVATDPAVLTGPPSPLRDAHLADLQRQVADRLAQPDLAGRKAGIVLTFGVAESPGDGINRASIFNNEILPRLGEDFRRADGPVVANRAFWGGRPAANKPPGTLSVNLYPIVDAQHGPLTQPPVDC